MPNPTPTSPALSDDIVNRVEGLLREAEKGEKPVEVDPFRGQLFELFVTAEGAGYLQDDTDTDLSAEGLCHRLAERWGLADAARSSFDQQTKLDPDHLSKMRLLWSLMRMWMEWSYAWERWTEFHDGESASQPPES